MATRRKTKSTDLKHKKDPEFTPYQIQHTNYANKDKDHTFCRHCQVSQPGRKRSNVPSRSTLSNSHNSHHVENSDTLNGHRASAASKSLVSHYISNGYDVYHTNYASSSDYSDPPSEDDSYAAGGHQRPVSWPSWGANVPNSALRWLKEPKSDSEEDDVLTKLVKAKQQARSLKWASPVNEGPSEGSIQASSQLLEEHVVLLNLEDERKPDISVVTPEAWPHLAQNSADINSQFKPKSSDISFVTPENLPHFAENSVDFNSLKPTCNNNNVDYEAIFDESFKNSIMPYSPGAVIDRFSPIFDDPRDEQQSYDSSSPEQVVPIKSHHIAAGTLCDHKEGTDAEETLNRTSEEFCSNSNNTASHDLQDVTEDAHVLPQSVPDLSVCSSDEKFIHENRLKSSDESYYELCFLTSASDAESDGQVNNGTYVCDDYAGNEASGAGVSDTVASKEPPLKPPRSFLQDSDDVKRCQPWTSSENIDKQLDQTDLAACGLPFPINGSMRYPDDSSDSLLEQLPEELIFKILFYFTIQELCTNVAPLSHKWKNFAYDPILWQIIDLSHHRYRNMGSVHLCRLLRRAKLLKSLNIRGRYTLNLTEVKILGYHCTMLQELNIGFCETLKDEIVQTIVDNCKALTAVNVEGSDSMDNQIAYYFTCLPELRVLNLSHCTKVTDESIISIAVLCQKLEALNIDGIPWITDTAIRCLATERQSTLEAVFLDGAELTDDSIENLTNCKKLHTLSISFCEEFTDRTLRYLKKLTAPKHLRLKRGVEFTEPALSDLCLTDNMASLTYLNLTECSELSDRGVENVTRMCKSLQHLALCWCWDVSDVGLECIVDNCCHLEVLDLLGLNKIKGGCLTRIPEALPKLKFLDLRQCNLIQDSMLVTLVTVKRDLNILNYYGEAVKVGSITVDEITEMLEQGLLPDQLPEQCLRPEDLDDVYFVSSHFEHA